MATPSAALVWQLTKGEFGERFAGSVLGATWAVVQPLVKLFVFLVVFGQIMGARLPGGSGPFGYGVYLACGLFPWMAFSQTVNRSCSIFLDKRGLISKISLSLPSLLLYVGLSESISFLLGMTALFGVMLATGQEFSRHLILLPFLFFLQQLFAFALGLLAATLTVFLRDLKEMMGVVMEIWFWGTPIVYVLDALPGWAQDIIRLNPATPVIEAYHSVFVHGAAPDMRVMIILALAAHGMIALAYLIFRVLEKDVRDFL